MEQIEFDHHAPDYARRNAEVFRELHGKCPVAHSSTYGGFWVLSRYEDVFEVARDDDTFSSARQVIIPANDVDRLIPLEADPPDLFRFRGVLLPFFSPKAIERLEPFMAETIDRCLDELLAAGGGDFVEQLANPVPSMTTMKMLGLPPEDWRTFADPLHRSSYSRPGTAENLAAIEDIAGFTSRIEAEIDARRAESRDDMISKLLDSEYEGVRTTRREVIDLVRMVIFGGMDTVMASISNMLLHLGRDLERRRQLIDDPGLIPTAIEEFLRYDTPVQGFARTVTRDCTVAGQQLAKDETVFMLWAAANRDPAMFDWPDELVLDRKPNRHMAFGIGAHRCLGSTMARSELRLTLERVLERLPAYRLIDGVEEPETVGIVFGRKRVPFVVA